MKGARGRDADIIPGSDAFPGVHALYAWRGWILAFPFLGVAAFRAFSDAPLRPEWLLLAALGAAWRLQAGRFISSHSNGLEMGSGPLATAGPYSLGRHPLYLSNILSAAGLLLFANSLPVWGAALLIAAVSLHHALLASAEERLLAAAHGEGYLRYMQVTPRWLGLPRSPALPDRSPARPDRGPVRPGSPGGGDTLASALRRQGGNLAKTAAAALLLWGLAQP